MKRIFDVFFIVLALVVAAGFAFAAVSAQSGVDIGDDAYPVYDEGYEPIVYTCEELALQGLWAERCDVPDPVEVEPEPVALVIVARVVPQPITARLASRTDLFVR